MNMYVLVKIIGNMLTKGVRKQKLLKIASILTTV